MKIIDRSHVKPSHQRFFKFKNLKKLTRKRQCRNGKWLVWQFCLTLWMKYGGIFLLLKSIGKLWTIWVSWRELKKLRLLVTSQWISIENTGAYTGGVHRCQWTPLEVSSFVSTCSKSFACALTACEHVFAIDHGRVSSHAHATFIQLSRIWLLQSAQDRVRVAREASYWLTALSRRGQGGSFRCKMVSTASVRRGAMTRRRASTATLYSQQNEERRV